MDSNTPSFEPVSAESVAWLGTGPIPAAPYYDPAYYELEREAVFKRSWLQVGHVCEIPEPGNFIRREVEVANASVLVVRGRDGAIRAFHNVCTHRGTQLEDAAEGKRANFSCPYHRWSFGTDGRLLSAPDFERFGLTKEECALRSIAVEICGGLIFINFNPSISLKDELGPFHERLEGFPSASATTFSEYVYEINGNWKLTYDNFQENYHLRFIHPRTGAAAGGEENPFGYPAKIGFHGPHRTQVIWANPNAKPNFIQGMAFKKGYEFALKDGLVGPYTRDYLALFPNFFIIGTPMQSFSHTIWPLGPGRSRGVIRLYWKGEDDCASRRFAREFSMATARDIHAEDRAVIEGGQKGLMSGALKHIHFQTQESLCRHFFNNVNERVEAYKAELAAAKGGQA
jgi:phenylpropionate dioxygenase-like ring-hydroxylating dioxygenase large terminal subunit